MTLLQVHVLSVSGTSLKCRIKNVTGRRFPRLLRNSQMPSFPMTSWIWKRQKKCSKNGELEIVCLMKFYCEFSFSFLEVSILKSYFVRIDFFLANPSFSMDTILELSAPIACRSGSIYIFISKIEFLQGSMFGTYFTPSCYL